VTFGLMYGSRAVSNQERVIVARVRYIKMVPYPILENCSMTPILNTGCLIWL
jgi:hypothetical protein